MDNKHKLHNCPRKIAIGKYAQLRAKNSSIYVTIYEDEISKLRLLICNQKNNSILNEIVINPNIIEITNDLNPKNKLKRKRIKLQ